MHRIPPAGHPNQQMPASFLLTTVLTAALLAPGDPISDLKGEFLTGKTVTLPAASTGKIALVAVGFSYDSRFAVEAWIARFRKDFGTRPEITFFEVPVIGGMARMAKWFIDSGMRSGTPTADREHVITVYGSSDAMEREAWL
jgi:hypothetical protein